MIKQTMAALLLSTAVASAAEFSIGTVTTEADSIEASGIELSFQNKSNGIEYGGTLISADDEGGNAVRGDAESLIDNLANGVSLSDIAINLPDGNYTYNKFEDKSKQIYVGKEINPGLTVGVQVRANDVTYESVDLDVNGSTGLVYVGEAKANDTDINGYAAYTISNGKLTGRAQLNTAGEIGIKGEAKIGNGFSAYFGYEAREASFDFEGGSIYSSPRTTRITPDSGSEDADLETTSFGIKYNLKF